MMKRKGNNQSSASYLSLICYSRLSNLWFARVCLRVNVLSAEIPGSGGDVFYPPWGGRSPRQVDSSRALAHHRQHTQPFRDVQSWQILSSTWLSEGEGGEVTCLASEVGDGLSAISLNFWYPTTSLPLTSPPIHPCGYRDSLSAFISSLARS